MMIIIIMVIKKKKMKKTLSNNKLDYDRAQAIVMVTDLCNISTVTIIMIKVFGGGTNSIT